MDKDPRKFDALPLFEQLQGLCFLQQELIRVSMYVATKGPIVYEGEKVTCSLKDGQRKTSTLLAFSASNSMTTLLDLSKREGMQTFDGGHMLGGLQIRDCYPIARSIIESFINAAYLLSESDSVSARAIKSVQFANWKFYNRKFGRGAFAIQVNSDPNPDKTLKTKFPEFIGKGKESWTLLDTPSRISRVGELAGPMAGSRLLAAYGLTYSLSSEILHGSPFGASFFYTSFLEKGNTTIDSFVEDTEKQMMQILVAVLHAGCGYLAAFFEFQNMKTLIAAEQRVFDQLLVVASRVNNKDKKDGKVTGQIVAYAVT